MKYGRKCKYILGTIFETILNYSAYDYSIIEKKMILDVAQTRILFLLNRWYDNGSKF